MRNIDDMLARVAALAIAPLGAVAILAGMHNESSEITISARLKANNTQTTEAVYLTLDGIDTEILAWKMDYPLSQTTFSEVICDTCDENGVIVAVRNGSVSLHVALIRVHESQISVFDRLVLHGTDAMETRCLGWMALASVPVPPNSGLRPHNDVFAKRVESPCRASTARGTALPGRS